MIPRFPPPDGGPKTQTTRDIVVFPVHEVPPTAVSCRVLPRFHGAFIVRFTALSPSSRKSGDTVTFVNKDQMPGARRFARVEFTRMAAIRGA